MNDYLSILPSLLRSSARQLDGVWFIPWPLWIGAFFPVYMSVVSFILWFRRGSTWPVWCIYPITSRHRDCRHLVPGEWYRCRHHNWRARYKHHGGHDVDTSLRRWQTIKRGRVIDRPDQGMGFLRVTPAKKTLLYRNGYARQPIDVLKLLPEAVYNLVVRLGRMRLRDPSDIYSDMPEDRSSGIQGVHVAEGLPLVIMATRFTLISTIVALLLTGIATIQFVARNDTARSVLQWVATLGFILAWAFVSRGVYHRRSNWLGSSVRSGLKWWLLTFVPVAATSLVLG